MHEVASQPCIRCFDLFHPATLYARPQFLIPAARTLLYMLASSFVTRNKK